MSEATGQSNLQSRLDTRLTDLRASLPALSAVVLATRSGLILAAQVEDDADADTLAALGADLLNSSEAAARALAGGEPRETTVRGAQAHVIVLGAGANAVLAALTEALTPASSVLPELREAARELGEALA